MILDDITFGTFREIEPCIMEIIVNEGVELSGQHIERIEAGLLEKYDRAYALLINRVNSYSHTLDSMKKVARLRNLVALAIVVYRVGSKHAAKIHQVYQDNVQIFADKESAVAWLRESMQMI